MSSNIPLGKAKNGFQVRMKCCVSLEPDPPADEAELEMWCSKGYSARPIQTHIGDTGRVLWINSDGSFCIAFDDGDERFLHADEIEWISIPD